MRLLRVALILGLCACATGSPAAKKSLDPKEPSHSPLAELDVTCEPVGSGPPLGFAFIAGAGEPSCDDCLAMLDSIDATCQAYPEYCPCLRRTFLTSCTRYLERIRERCKEDEQKSLPVCGPLVQG